MCFNFLNFPNSSRRNVSESLSQVFQPQKMVEMSKSISTSTDGSIVKLSDQYLFASVITYLGYKIPNQPVP